MSLLETILSWLPSLWKFMPKTVHDQVRNVVVSKFETILKEYIKSKTDLPIGDFVTAWLKKHLETPTAVPSAFASLAETGPGAAVKEYTTSPEFAAAANAAVPPPQAGESEQSFMQRAQAELGKLVAAKIGGAS